MTPDALIAAAKGYGMKTLIIVARVLAILSGLLGWIPLFGLFIGPVVVLVLLVFGIGFGVFGWVMGLRRTDDPDVRYMVRRISILNIVCYVIGIILATSGFAANILFSLAMGGGQNL